MTIDPELRRALARVEYANTEVNWRRLGLALSLADLRDEAGNKVRRDEGDFMLMSANADGTLWFKSRDTRNYVALSPDGTLHVPKKSEAFQRGFF